ncbi:MAG: DUF1022 domain-containing protein, partial [uncultured Acetobacteraceae bacterium]
DRRGRRGLGPGGPARGHGGAGARHRGTPRRAVPRRGPALGRARGAAPPLAFTARPDACGARAVAAALAAAGDLSRAPLRAGVALARAAGRADGALHEARLRPTPIRPPGARPPRRAAGGAEHPADPGRHAPRLAGGARRGAGRLGRARRHARAARRVADGGEGARDRHGRRSRRFGRRASRGLRRKRAGEHEPPHRRGRHRRPRRSPARGAAPPVPLGRRRTEPLSRLPGLGGRGGGDGRFRVHAVGGAGDVRPGVHRRSRRPRPAAPGAAREPLRRRAGAAFHRRPRVLRARAARRERPCGLRHPRARIDL